MLTVFPSKFFHRPIFILPWIYKNFLENLKFLFFYGISSNDWGKILWILSKISETLQLSSICHWNKSQMLLKEYRKKLWILPKDKQKKKDNFDKQCGKNITNFTQRSLNWVANFLNLSWKDIANFANQLSKTIANFDRWLHEKLFINWSQKKKFIKELQKENPNLIKRSLKENVKFLKYCRKSKFHQKIVVGGKKVNFVEVLCYRNNISSKNCCKKCEFYLRITGKNASFVKGS